MEMCAEDWLLVQSIDAYILQAGAFNKKRRQAYALTVQRMQIADGLTRRLQALGLQRRSKLVRSLSDYLSTNGKRKSPTPSSPSTGDVHLRVVYLPVYVRRKRKPRLPLLL